MKEDETTKKMKTRRRVSESSSEEEKHQGETEERPRRWTRNYEIALLRFVCKCSEG
jgi:hypothetical protein